jgi:hypothetical protein
MPYLESRNDMTPETAAERVLGMFLQEANRKPAETDKMLAHLDWLADYSALPQAISRRFRDKGSLLNRLVEISGVSQQSLLKSDQKAHKAVIDLAAEIFEPTAQPD